MAAGAAKRCWKEKKLPWKEKPAAKRTLSQPVTRLRAIFSQFLLFPLTLRLIGGRRFDE